ncbi:peptidase domain-containing ABC transporter [Nitratireductor sp. ZSWI3]|uniref:peptidase domain-containing ABC transporter n=1 Tax=Nitratireductor sp. ZSWI3 TaxID=2966359 RepID=UPI002150621F|nr:peptidase domain-containing ABC transporter [Nitratireductor sp. ZSWI3]MCR4268897.1 peptidase domain-containing ABC transporter [Nitratireductor sp. ZSWI3]
MSQTSLPAAREIPLRWFGQTLHKFVPIFAELTFLAICLRLIGLIQPFIFQVVIDRILPFQREASLVVVVIVLAAASLFQSGFNILSSLLGMLTANRITSELGSRIFAHLFKLPLSHFRRWPVGETITRVGETDTIRAFLLGTTTGVFLDLVFVVIYLAILFALSTKLTLLVLVALPLQMIVYLGFGPFLRRRLREQFDAGSKHQSGMVENLCGAVSVKALGAENIMLDRLNGTLSRSLDAGRRVQLLGIASGELTSIFERMVTIGIVFIGARQVFSGDLTLGQLIAFQLVAEKIAGPVAGFSRLWQDWQNLKVSRQRLGDIVNTPIEPFGERPPLPAELPPRLEFRKVGFAYTAGHPVLRGFNLVAEPHTCTVVVGPSGIGKSTFGRLAAGLEAPDDGQILFGGEDIAARDPASVRARIAYVPQEPYLFSGSLRANLLMENGDARDEDLRAALKVAAAAELPEQLIGGFEAEVGERGSALSGGQRQRVAIARAVLQKPSVLILDEPTSALDENAQRRMVHELMALRQQMTLVIITHRPDVFARADAFVDFGRSEVF